MKTPSFGHRLTPTQRRKIGFFSILERSSEFSNHETSDSSSLLVYQLESGSTSPFRVCFIWGLIVPWGCRSPSPPSSFLVLFSFVVCFDLRLTSQSHRQSHLLGLLASSLAFRSREVTYPPPLNKSFEPNPLWTMQDLCLLESTTCWLEQVLGEGDVLT